MGTNKLEELLMSRRPFDEITLPLSHKLSRETVRAVLMFPGDNHTAGTNLLNQGNKDSNYYSLFKEFDRQPLPSIDPPRNESEKMGFVKIFVEEALVCLKDNRWNRQFVTDSGTIPVTVAETNTLDALFLLAAPRHNVVIGSDACPTIRKCDLDLIEGIIRGLQTHLQNYRAACESYTALQTAYDEYQEAINETPADMCEKFSSIALTGKDYESELTAKLASIKSLKQTLVDFYDNNIAGDGSLQLDATTRTTFQA
jgi:hypothetical protein